MDGWLVVFLMALMPYVSQVGHGANGAIEDCGAAAASMVIEAETGMALSPDFLMAGRDGPLHIREVRSLLDTYGVPAKIVEGDRTLQLGDIVLLNASYYSDAGWHYVVILYEDHDYMYVHDPLYGPVLAIPMGPFLTGWGEPGWWSITHE